MPIFEYECRDCSARFELLVRGSDAPACPRCRSEDLAKQLSVFAVSAPASTVARGTGPGACGSCGDPRGPGACRLD